MDRDLEVLNILSDNFSTHRSMYIEKSFEAFFQDGSEAQKKEAYHLYGLYKGASKAYNLVSVFMHKESTSKPPIENETKNP